MQVELGEHVPKFPDEIGPVFGTQAEGDQRPGITEDRVTDVALELVYDQPPNGGPS